MSSVTTHQPRRILVGTVTEGEHGRAATTVLRDFEDALMAYDRYSARVLDAPQDLQPPTFLHAGDIRAAAPGPDDARAGALVVAAWDAEVDRAALDVLVAHTLPQAPAWGILLCPERGAQDAPCKAAQMAEALGEHYAGTLICQNALGVLASANAARMGRKRRRRSEAVDHLVGAVRAGLSVKVAARTFGGQNELSENNIITDSRPRTHRG